MTISQTVEAVAAKAAPAATYGGGSVAFIGGLTANEVAAVGGLVIGCIGLLVNWYYKHKHYKLAERRMEEPHAD
jgi:hypothetical protein